MGRTCPIQSDPAGGWAQPAVRGSWFGGGTTAGTGFLALLYARDEKNRDCFWQREGSGRTMVTVTMPQPT